MRTFLGVDEIRSGGREAAFEQLRARIRERAASTEVLVAGNSHLAAALPDRLFTTVFATNLSVNSQDAEYCTRMVERFAPEMPRLRTVLFLLEPLTPGFRLQDHEYGRGQIFDYETVFGFPPEGTGTLRGRIAHESRRLYFIRYHDRFLKFLHGWLAARRAARPAPLPAPAEVAEPEERVTPLLPAGELAVTGRMQALHHFATLYRPAATADTLASLMRAVAFCRARRLRLVFVTPPYANHYSERIPAFARADLDATLRALRAAHGDAFATLDASDLYATEHALFADSDHLNPAGAARFVREVEERLAP